MMLLLILAAAVALPPGYEWHDFGDGSRQYALMRHGQQIGAYNADTGIYRPFDARRRTWGDPVEAPVEVPVKNFGLIGERRPEHQFRSNGQVVSEEEAFAALRDEPKPVPTPADESKLRVVVIGHAADTAKVQAAWDSDNALSCFRDAMVFQQYEPADWQVAEYGFVTSGRPTIYVLTPDGTVLHRQDDFEGGASALAEALRAANSAYSGDKDVDRRNVMADVMSRVKQIPPAAALLGAVAVLAGLVLFMKKGK